MPNIIETIKRAALEAVEASKPCAVMFGKVASISPLKISIDQKLTLTAAQIVMTNATSNHAYSTDNYTHTHTLTGVTGTVSQNTHKHQITAQNSLVVGDTAILLRMQGGQKYIVLGKRV